MWTDQWKLQDQLYRQTHSNSALNKDADASSSKVQNRRRTVQHSITMLSCLTHPEDAGKLLSLALRAHQMSLPVPAQDRCNIAQDAVRIRVARLVYADEAQQQPYIGAIMSASQRSAKETMKEVLEHAAKPHLTHGPSECGDSSRDSPNAYIAAQAGYAFESVPLDFQVSAVMEGSDTFLLYASLPSPNRQHTPPTHAVYTTRGSSDLSYTSTTHLCRGDNRTRAKQARRPWSADEHARFVESLKRFGSDCTDKAESGGGVTVSLGPGVADLMAVVVGTRTVSQVTSHAQKYFLRLRRLAASGSNSGQTPASSTTTTTVPPKTQTIVHFPPTFNIEYSQVANPPCASDKLRGCCSLSLQSLDADKIVSHILKDVLTTCLSAELATSHADTQRWKFSKVRFLFNFPHELTTALNFENNQQSRSSLPSHASPSRRHHRLLLREKK